MPLFTKGTSFSPSPLLPPPLSSPCLSHPLQNLDRLIRSNASDHFRRLESLLAALPQRCLFMAAYCSRSLNREQARMGGGLGAVRLLGLGAPGLGGDSGGGALDDLPEMYRYGRLARGSGGGSQRKSSKGRMLARMLPNHVELHPPNQDSQVGGGAEVVDWAGLFSMPGA